MQPIEAYKHLCTVAVIAIVLGLWFLLWKWPQGRHMTFSQHAAQHKSAIIFYICFFTIVLPLLLLFFAGWFAPAFQLSPIFSYFIVAAILFQYSVALIPEVGGWKTTYHIFGSAMSGVSMLLALGMLLLASTINGRGKTVIFLSFLLMIALLYIGAINKIKHSNLLILQASYYLAFFGTILFVAYFGAV